MRILIDGYNLMYAAGSVTRPGPAGLRQARNRFLNKLAEALDPVDAHQTTIVFDANNAPDHLEPSVRHKGLTVVFAVNEPTADEKLELLIQHHPDPKRLRVVSSDNRVRTAALRRRAKVSTADEFLNELDRNRERRLARSPATPRLPEKPQTLSQQETNHWLAEFEEIESSEEFAQAFRPAVLLTDAEVRRIEHEVETEGDGAHWNPPQSGRLPRRPKG